ncbi:hypothetical protein M0811_04550 [Anaeramoeba ignava]|uniref:Uncharacterized protein n=1 Tax=Anaeramoeba ignava TaxID=1746090 RepID=A0A9Q0LTP2_ANAIG|nr:hypothetical protein M0811_04550 [Anaeramoeba ignava]
MESGVKRKNLASVQRYVKESKEYLEKNGDVFEKNEKGQKFKSRKTKEILRQANGALGWSQSALKRKEPEKALKYWTECKEKAQPLLSEPKFEAIPDVKKFLDEFHEFEKTIEGDAESQVKQKELETDKKKIENTFYWIKNCYTKKEAENSLKKAADFQSDWEQFMQKYGDEQSLAGFIKDTQDILDKIHEEAPKWIEDKEVEKVIHGCKSQLSWLNSALQRKEAEKASNYRQKLEEAAIPLRSQFGENKMAQEFIEKEVDPILEKVEAELGVIIEDQEVDKIIQKCTSIKSWLQSTLSRSEAQKASEYRKQLEEAVIPLREAHADHEKAKKFLDETDKLLEEVEKQLGVIIKQLEIKQYSQPINGIMSWLESAIKQKNVDNVVKYREQLVQAANPLRRYEEESDVKNTLSKVDALLQRLETELGELITEKEVNRLLPGVKSTFSWLESAFKQKSVAKVQIYQKQLEEKLNPLQEFSQHKDAEEWITKSQALIKQVEDSMGELIAEMEINEQKTRVESAIRFFEDAMNKSDVNAIVRKREALLTVIAPLREKYGSHNLAQPLLTKADTALHRCETDLGEVIANEKAKEISGKIMPLSNLLKQAFAQNDNSAACAYVLKIQKLVHPLRVEYPTVNAVMKLTSEIDSSNNQIQVKLSSYQEKDLHKYLDPITEALNQTGAFKVPRDLTPFITKSLPLRQNYIHIQNVRDTLVKFDTICLKMIGRVPEPVEEYAPIFEVHWKLPQQVQTALKGINETSKQINSLMDEAKNSIEEVSTTGETQMHRNLADQFVDHYDKVSSHITRLERELEKLESADPEHAGIALVKESIAKLRQILPQKKNEAVEKCNYAFSVASIYGPCVAGGAGVVENAIESSDAKNCSISFDNVLMRSNAFMWGGPRLSGMSHSSMWPTVISWFEYTKGKAEEVKRMRPDNHPEVDMIIKQLDASFITAQNHFLETTKKWAVLYYKDGSYESGDRFISEYEKVYPNTGYLDDIKKQCVAIKQEVEDRRRREEEERKRKAEEERMRKVNLAIELEKKFKEPFDDGVIQTPDSGKWKYTKDGTLTCLDGAYIGLSFKLQRSERSGTLDLVSETGAHGWGEFNGTDFYWGHQLGWPLHLKFDTEEYPHRLNWEKFDTVKKLVEATQSSGNVPPFCVVWCAMFHASQKYIQRYKEAEQERLQKEREEKQRKDTLNNLISKFGSCKRCHTSGANIRCCPDCHYVFCTNCSNSGRGVNVCPSCGEYHCETHFL